VWEIPELLSPAEPSFAESLSVTVPRLWLDLPEQLGNGWNSTKGDLAGGREPSHRVVDSSERLSITKVKALPLFQQQ
jgi:hypothetical protein